MSRKYKFRDQINQFIKLSQADACARQGYFIFFLTFIFSFNSHSQSLTTFQHGIDMLDRKASKNELISDIVFKDGRDSCVNVLRIDHLGSRGDGPIIIASKLVLPSDSLMLTLELIPVMLEDSIFNLFLNAVDKVGAKEFVPQNIDNVLLRFTYRIDGNVHQYFLTNGHLTSGVMQMLEGILEENCSDEVIDSYYRFLKWTGLFYYQVKG